jgi:hypothetical protein
MAPPSLRARHNRKSGTEAPLGGAAVGNALRGRVLIFVRSSEALLIYAT